MRITLPFVVVKWAAVLWILTAPMLWLGAMVTEIEPVRYFVQLALASIVVALALAALIGAFCDCSWARLVLLLISWPTAIFWFYDSYAVAQVESLYDPTEYVFIAAIGGFYLIIALLLHFTAKCPTRDVSLTIDKKTKEYVLVAAIAGFYLVIALLLHFT